VLAALVSVSVAALGLLLAPLVVGPSERAVGIPSSGSSVTGAWSGVLDWPVMPIHSILAPDGKVVTWGLQSGSGPGSHFYDVWDPSLGTGSGSHSLSPNPTESLFCSGHVLAANGDVLVFGGTAPLPGNSRFTTFAPVTHRLTDTGTPMAYPRWYPTSTTLPDGRVLVQGGTDRDFEGAPQITPEIYTPGSGWRTLTGATSNAVYGNIESRPGWYYPRTWVQPDGRIFAITQKNIYYLNPSGSGSIQLLSQQWNRARGVGSTAVMYRPGKILFAGGHEADTPDASAQATTVDVTGASPVLAATGSMKAKREWANSTLLPDGRVLVTGGSGKFNELVDVAYKPEIWDPATGIWSELAASQVPRLYHSSSLLLPDASVLVAGGGDPGPVRNLNAEIFYPPYLYQANGTPAPRPAWGTVPTAIPFSAQFGARLASGGSISRVTLIKAGSVTHSFDMEGRFIELGFTQSGDQLTINGPANASVATPGYYLLFAVDGRGVPSVAATVRVGAGSAGSAPLAAATAVPASGPAPLTVTFNGAGSRDPDGDPLTFAWDFGDGQGSTQVRPRHSFTTRGVHIVTLTVRDDKGWSGRAQVTITVGTPVKPKAGATTRLGLRAIGPRRVKRGKTLTYRLVVRNRGAATARKLTVVQKVPPSLRLVKRSRAVTFRKGQVTWRVGNLARGGQKTLSLTFRTPAKAAGRITARATALASNAPRTTAGKSTLVVR
jgi:uncharacterized repeat protein (TIGR01451 family)